jgi:urease accessory protein
MRQSARQSSSDGATSALFAANRAVGTVELTAQKTGVSTQRQVVRESGSLRVRFPSPETDALSAVLINTAGGVAGGDCFTVAIEAATDANVVVTTAAAEKIYRSHGADSRVDVSLHAADGARIAWLPQETILFDRALLTRHIDISLAENASVLCAEIAVFGRTAMNEQLHHGRFVDRWRLRRAGKLIFAETMRLEGDITAKLAHRAVANGGVAVATVLIVPGDEALVTRVRDLADRFHCETGISSWNGFALARLCGADAARLRTDVMTLLQAVGTEALPRLWLN